MFRVTKFDTLKKIRVRCSLGMRPKTSDSVNQKISKLFGQYERMKKALLEISFTPLRTAKHRTR